MRSPLTPTVRIRRPLFVRRRRDRLVALVTLEAILLAGCQQAQPAAPAASEIAPPTSPIAVEQEGQFSWQPSLEELDKSLLDIEAGELESPRDRWDPVYVVEQLGTDAETLLEWVRDETFWIPYRGRLRGPLGVLMDRQGNTLDRTLLLEALLQQAGHRTRLMHDSLSPREARELLPKLAAARRSGMRQLPGDELGEATPAAVVTLASDFDFGSDANSGVPDGWLERAIGEQLRLHQDIEQRIADQASRLRLTVASTEDPERPRQRIESALEALTDHWWLEVQGDGGWRRFDLLKADPSSTPGEPEVDGPQHAITLEVQAERWTGGYLEVQTVLTHTLVPADLLGRSVVLQIWPSSLATDLPPFTLDPQEEVLSTVREEEQWILGLFVDGEVVAQATIDDAGQLVHEPAGGPMGGLASAFSQGAAQPTPRDGVFTALWLDYALDAPSTAPRHERRVLFDLVGPAARSRGVVASVPLDDAARLRRSLALTMRTELLPIACDVPPELVTHLLATGLLGSRDLLGAATQGADRRTIDEAIGTSTPLPTPLYALALGRFAGSAGRSEVYIDRPGLFTRHVYLDLLGDRLVARESVDIVSNEVGVDLLADDPFSIRLAQGLRDTHAESLLVPGATRARALAGTAAAYDGASKWTLVTTGKEIAASPDLKERLLADRKAGYQVVAPVSSPEGSLVGWWRIDPQTGHTLGMDKNGWGGATVERSFWLNALSRFSKAFFFDFFLCGAAVTTQSIEDGPGVAEGIRSVPGQCIGDAIAIGALATLPLIWITLATRLRGLGWVFRGGPRMPPPPEPPPDTQRDISRDPTQPDITRDPTQPDISRDPTQPDITRDPTQPDITRDPTQPDSPPTQRSPQPPPEEPRERKPGEIRANRHTNDPAILQQQFDQAFKDWLEASQRAREAEARWWEARAQAALEGREPPPMPDDVKRAVAEAEAKAAIAEDLRLRLKSANEDAAAAGRRAQRSGTRQGDTLPSGQNPEPPPPPPPCPEPCNGLDKTQPILPQGRTLTGIGGVGTAMGGTGQ